MPFRTDAGYARELDQQDELAAFRDRFVSDDPELIYLDGNSLGRLPKATATRLRHFVAEEWGQRLIRGWNEGWFTLAQQIGAKIARLIGAEADEVIVSDSTSVNLFKLAVAALQAQSDRSQLLTDDLNFPSDLYILQGAIKSAGAGQTLTIVPSADGVYGPVTQLSQAMGDNTALVALSHTVFKSGYTYDLAEITAQARRAGALTLWDLSHSVGVVPIALGAAGVDLAVGSTYKYLCGGPGAPAFLYVRRQLQQRLHNPISGWFGQKGQFDFELAYRPADGLRRFLAGTPPLLSLAAIEPGVELLLEAGIERVRLKSLRQTEYLIDLGQALLAPLGFQLKSPSEPARRGSHVSFGHPEGQRIDRALIEEMQVLPDFRTPDIIRLGIAPLYTSFADIHTAVLRLRSVVLDRLYEKYPADRLPVT